MRPILRREFINRTALVAGAATGTLLAEATLAQVQGHGRSEMTHARLSASFLDVLHTDRPAADRAEKMGLYGWLVGRWTIEAIYHLNDGTTRRGRGEIHAGWVLEGRALQDVWIVPARDAQRADPPGPGDFYGTTLRVYDPKLDAWHIVWTDPLNQVYRQQIGRAHGDDIVQDGTDETGAPVRWSFTEITPDSFRWLGERSADGGTTFRLLVEFLARRDQG
jgi:hypothetical protein